MSKKRMILVTKDNIGRLYGIINKNMILSSLSNNYWSYQVSKNIKNHKFKAYAKITDVLYRDNMIRINTNVSCGRPRLYLEIEPGNRVHINNNKLTVQQRDRDGNHIYIIFTYGVSNILKMGLK